MIFGRKEKHSMAKKLRKFWITDIRIGKLKRKILLFLQKIYHFPAWNIIPINDRPYAREIVCHIQKYVDKKKRCNIVEVGCGLGSIIGNIKDCGKRIGVDINNTSIYVARILHPFVEFRTGSFKDVDVGKIDCLIMVNFIHRIPEDKLRHDVQTLIAHNQVKVIVFDTFKNNRNTEYLYSHRGEYLLGDKYRLIRRSRGFGASHGARRYIEYWEKI